MKICFTSMHENGLIHVCDLITKKVTTIPRTFTIEDHRPFGITWSPDKLYLAQPTTLLQLNKRLRFEKVLLRGMWYGTHQILYHNGVLWMVCPRLNAIQRYNLRTNTFDYFFPDEGIITPTLPKEFDGKNRLEYTQDVSHYNSILFHDNKLYLSAHNHEYPSFISVYDYPSLKLLRRHGKMGTQIHNIAVDGDEIFTLDSLGSHCIVSTEGARIPVGKDGDFLRGLIVTKSHFVVAKFPYEEDRIHRRQGNAEIIILERNGKEVERLLVKDSGNINDLRLLDKPDMSHGIPSFWGEGNYEIFKGMLI